MGKFYCSERTVILSSHKVHNAAFNIKIIFLQLVYINNYFRVISINNIHPLVNILDEWKQKSVNALHKIRFWHLADGASVFVVIRAAATEKFSKIVVNCI